MAQMDRMRPEGLPAGRGGARVRHAGGVPAGPEGLLDLIHTTNSPNPVTARVSGRFRVSVQDPSGIPLQDVFRVIAGELSPVEFLVMRRAANEATKSRK